jgi:hypothetical protein
MAEALAYEKADEHGNTIKRFTAIAGRPPRKSRQAKKQRIDTAEAAASSDEDDHDYQNTEPAESESTSHSEGNCEDLLPSNAEVSFLYLIVPFMTPPTICPQVADILPSKTIPAVGRGGSGKRTRSKPVPSFEDIQPISRTESLRSLSSNKDTCERASKPMVRWTCFLLSLNLRLNCWCRKSKGTRNPIYHFYEAVERNSSGEPGNVGDRHYKCLHGNAKVLTVTKKMKYSVNGKSYNTQLHVMCAHYFLQV